MPPAEGSAPLADDELDDLFATLAGARLIALAVSGGPDSLGLLDVVDRWRRRAGRPAVVVLTVDHGLRAGSAQEAAGVARIAGERGLYARVLTWEGLHPTSGIEAASRAARYGLLIAAARDLGATLLVTAHHRDDQAETFLIRLLRGSGVSGLAAMRREVSAGGLTLVRPLLGVPRARIAATAKAAGLTAIDDPMNTDPRYLRSRVRQMMPTFAGAGLDAARLTALARRMELAASALDAEATMLLAQAVTVDALAVARLDPALFAAAPSDVRLRALVRLLIAVGGEDYPPRHERLVVLADRLARCAEQPHLKRTLSGVVVELRGGRVLFYREIGRRGLPTLPAPPGFAGVWDHRFAVDVGADAPAGLSLAAVGEEGRRMIDVRPRGVPAAAIAALPAVSSEGHLCSVPAVDWSDGSSGAAVRLTQIVAGRLREPPLFPDFSRNAESGEALGNGAGRLVSALFAS